MKVESFKVICYEDTSIYDESPCYSTLKEAVTYLWDHPCGDAYYTWDDDSISIEITSFDQLLEAVQNKRFNPFPKDDRKFYVVQHHSIDVDISKFTESLVKSEKFWKDKWFEQRDVTGRLGLKEIEQRHKENLNVKRI